MSDVPKVLIVEDEAILAENLRRYLERRGWQARVANTGHDAVAACPLFQPDAILLDYALPDMDGFEVLCALGRRGCADCLLMTAHPPEVVSERARELGVRRVLLKPFPLADTESELRAASASREG